MERAHSGQVTLTQTCLLLFSDCFQVFFCCHEGFLVGEVLCWGTGAMSIPDGC